MASLKEGADRLCTGNGVLTLRQLKSIAPNDDGVHRELVPQNGHDKPDDLEPTPVNIWEYLGGRVNGASSKLVYKTTQSARSEEKEKEAREKKEAKESREKEKEKEKERQAAAGR